MTLTFPQQLIELLQDPAAVKVLATTDEEGVPHLAVKQSLQLEEDGTLTYCEFLESSSSNRNMVRSIWFNRSVALSIVGKGQSYLIKGRPVKTVIAGPLFRRHYQAVRERSGEVDLAAVWVIEPEQLLDQSLERRRSEEERKFPFFNHLDRLAKAS